MKVLIANRGEIAARIERTCHRLGHESVPIAVAGDLFALESVRSRCETVPSYLDGEAIIETALRTGCDSVHPGFGFLSENASFARQVQTAGLTWIGPSPHVVEHMGSKINARELAASAGVPLIPGYSESQVDDDLADAAERIGFPVLVKASAGGGGKGIRIANQASDFSAALGQARSEAHRLFGDDSVVVERFIARPRHIEVQVIGDSHGNLYHLGTRECSVQRRYQKLFEEAPAPNLSDDTRRALHDSAVVLARAVSYESAGTVEFLVDDDTGDHFFLEMNTRLQVEHPVTEQVTGLDLVELMLTVAAGGALDDLSHVEFEGHALEARILAEDAANNFLPAVGHIDVLEVPDGVRWDGGGRTVTTDYDPMIAKLIVHGPNRGAALAKMRVALDQILIAGVRTITGFHRWLVDLPQVVDGTVTTRLLDESEFEPPTLDQSQLTQAVEAASRSSRTGLWGDLSNLSVTPHASSWVVGVRDSDGQVHEVHLGPKGSRSTASSTDGALWQRGPTRFAAFNASGQTHTFEIVDRTSLWAPKSSDRVGSGAELVAPFPALVAEVLVAPGDEVSADQVLVVVEAMKMLHSLTADGTAVVDQVLVNAGDQVDGAQTLVTFVTDEATDEATDGASDGTSDGANEQEPRQPSERL